MCQEKGQKPIQKIIERGSFPFLSQARLVLCFTKRETNLSLLNKKGVMFPLHFWSTSAKATVLPPPAFSPVKLFPILQWTSAGLQEKS